MSYHVVWTKRAAKQLLSIPKKQRLMIVEWVRKNLDGASNPKSLDGARKLQGTKRGWRYRVGSYRILASIIDEEVKIEIVRVGHRQGVYENLPEM